MSVAPGQSLKPKVKFWLDLGDSRTVDLDRNQLTIVNVLFQWVRSLYLMAILVNRVDKVSQGDLVSLVVTVEMDHLVDQAPKVHEDQQDQEEV